MLKYFEAEKKANKDYILSHLDKIILISMGDELILYCSKKKKKRPDVVDSHHGVK